MHEISQNPMSTSAEETLQHPVFITITPKITVEWLAVLCIWDASASNLSQQTNLPKQGSSWYSSVFQAKAGAVP
jgi:hypothetical protein